jgi:branched-chain amino acid transport system ATP-binding protein
LAAKALAARMEAPRSGGAQVEAPAATVKASDSQVVLTLHEVVAGYGEIVVLKGVRCEVKRGCITSIIGANGAGKSTLLKTIFGIVRPRQGAIVYEGRTISGLSSLEILKAGISYVPQGRCNFPALTVLENLRLGAYIRRDSGIRADIDALCSRFKVLGEKRAEMAGNLSGGQQQILEMAMALLLSPNILLIDEPSLGLSPKLVDEVFEAIEQIKANGTTVVMVEQNAKRALAMSDYAFVLELGRNWLDGTGQAILNDARVRSHYLGL